jgi:hypothetical protein
MNNEKKGMIWWLILSLGFFAIGVWYYVTGWTDIVNEFTNNHEDFNNVLFQAGSDDEIKGYYATEIDASLGSFATLTKNGDVETAYYIVWLSDDSIAAASVGKESSMTELDRIAEETWAYVNGDSDHLTSDTFIGTAKVSAFDGSFHTMYMQTLEEMGVTDSNLVIRDIILDYKEGGIIKHDAIFFGIFGLIGFVGLIITLFAMVGGKKREFGTDLVLEKEERVSFKQAKSRITNPEIRGSYNKMSRVAALLLAAFALSLIIPGALYAYTAISSANADASQRVATYYLSDYDTVNGAAENATAELTITTEPILIFTENTDNYYILDYNGLYFVGIIDSKDFDRIKSEIKENGRYTLYGYLQTPSDKAKDSALEYVNSIYGTDHKSKDYDLYLGKYALNVEENYAGVGIPVEKIKNFMIGEAIFIICLGLFGFTVLSRSRYMINSLRRFSDSEYALLEKELLGNCERYDQNLILTEHFIVMLYSYSIFKDSSQNANATFFAKYSDIRWIYPSNHMTGGKVTNYGVTVYGPQVGTSTLIGLPAREDCVVIIENLISSLMAKCPGALFGYTEENKNKLAG